MRFEQRETIDAKIAESTRFVSSSPQALSPRLTDSEVRQLIELWMDNQELGSASNNRATTIRDFAEGMGMTEENAASLYASLQQQQFLAARMREEEDQQRQTSLPVGHQAALSYTLRSQSNRQLFLTLVICTLILFVFTMGLLLITTHH